MQSKSALRGRKINNFVELWCLVASRGYKFWVSWISCQKSNIGCPQQPLTEKVLKSVKNWIIDDPFHKNGPVLVILVPGMIKPSGWVFFLIKWGCWGHWGHWGHSNVCIFLNSLFEGRFRYSMILSVVDVQNKKSMKKITFDIEVFLRKILKTVFLISEFWIRNSVIYRLMIL